MQSPTLPDGFTARSQSECEIRFNWYERLRVLFGRPTRVRQEMFFRQSPGGFEVGSVHLDVAPIGGKLPE